MMAEVKQEEDKAKMLLGVKTFGRLQGHNSATT